MSEEENVKVRDEIMESAQQMVGYLIRKAKANPAADPNWRYQIVENATTGRIQIFNKDDDLLVTATWENPPLRVSLFDADMHEALRQRRPWKLVITGYHFEAQTVRYKPKREGELLRLSPAALSRFVDYARKRQEEIAQRTSMERDIADTKAKARRELQEFAQHTDDLFDRWSFAVDRRTFTFTVEPRPTGKVRVMCNDSRDSHHVWPDEIKAWAETTARYHTNMDDFGRDRG